VERRLPDGLTVERVSETALTFGDVASGMTHTRHFHAVNTSNLDMHIRWQVFVHCAGEKKVDVNRLVVDEETKEVSLDWQFHGEEVPAPFVVEPAETVMKAGATSGFKLTFFRQGPAFESGYLVGTQKVHSPDSELRIKLWDAEDGSLEARMDGAFHPHAAPPHLDPKPLRLNITAEAKASYLEPDFTEALHWTVWSCNNPATHPTFVRHVTFSNLHRMPTAFSCEATGRFDIDAVATSFPDVPDDLGALQSATTQKLGGLKATVLPPRENVDLKLRFCPEKVKEVDEERVDYRTEGVLVMHYQNGDRQDYPLTASVTHPALDVSRGWLHFNAVHVNTPKPLEVVLTNNTFADAEWVVVEEGQEPSFTPAGKPVPARGPTATVGEFTVSPGGGLLAGTGLETPKQQRVVITLAPPSDGTFTRRVRFAVRKGRGATVECVGEGTYDEHREHQIKLKVLK